MDIQPKKGSIMKNHKNKTDQPAQKKKLKENLFR